MTEIVAFHAKHDPLDRWKAAIEPLIDNLVVQRAAEVTTPERVRYVMAWQPPSGFFGQFPNLELVINLGAGIDRLLANGDLPEVPVVRLVDPGMGRMMLGYVLMGVLRHARDLPRFEAAQRRKEWTFIQPRHAPDMVVTVLGLGELGALAATEIARLGYQVHGWATRPRDLPGVTVHTGLEALPALLARTDILVSLLPLTAATRGLLDAQAFATMKPGAAFVNASRGAIVDEAAMTAALQSGHLSGATLDVFQQEPLPPESPLWTMPNVLITPHIASLGMPETAAPQIARNIAAIRTGQPLIHQVSLARGY